MTQGFPVFNFPSGYLELFILFAFEKQRFSQGNATTAYHF